MRDNLDLVMISSLLFFRCPPLLFLVTLPFFQCYQQSSGLRSGHRSHHLLEAHVNYENS
jgi:hypothetical protein